MTASPMHPLISRLHFVRASAKLDGLQEIYETAGMRTLSHSVAVRSQQASTSEQLALLRRDEDAPRTGFEHFAQRSESTTQFTLR